jgi:hypothetical protein
MASTSIEAWNPPEFESWLSHQACGSPEPMLGELTPLAQLDVSSRTLRGKYMKQFRLTKRLNNLALTSHNSSMKKYKRT